MAPCTNVAPALPLPACPAAPHVQVGIRLNRKPPNITYKKKKTGGITVNSMLKLTHMDDKMVQRILQVGTAVHGVAGRAARVWMIWRVGVLACVHIWRVHVRAGWRARAGHACAQTQHLPLPPITSRPQPLAGVQDPQLRPPVQGGLNSGRSY